jgi:hypothetical protein
VKHLSQSIAANPEPAILALSVIIFFLLLGHKAGTYLRHLIVLSPTSAMRTHSRQAFAPLTKQLGDAYTRWHELESRSS